MPRLVGRTAPAEQYHEEARPCLEILRAWGAASGPGKKPVGLRDAASLVKMAENTITLANPFFTDIGLLQRVDGGFVPSDEVLSFNHAFQWNADTASQKLAPIIEQAWFSQALLPQLGFGAVPEGEAIATLSETANASRDYIDQLGLLLQYMQAAGIVVNENGAIRPVSIGGLRQSLSAESQPVVAVSPAGPTTTSAGNESREQQTKFSNVSTSFSKPTEGMINFHVSFRVDMQEMSGWSADRIGRFFSGIAEVLSAKGSIEEKAASS